MKQETKKQMKKGASIPRASRPLSALGLQPTLDMRDIARSGHVTRWHSVRTGRDQTLAEHHYMVAMIVNDLSRRIFGDSIIPEQRLELLEYALCHDAAELLMGDLPSPLKRRVEQLCPGPANPLGQLEKQIAPEIAALKERVQRFQPSAILVKLADLMDAIHFLSQEGIGRHAEEVCVQLRQHFAKVVAMASEQYPKFRWEAAQELLGIMENEAANQIAFEADPDLMRC